MLNHHNCVYMYVNIINGKKYIGQTVNFNLRHNSHKHCASNPKDLSYLNRPFYRALRKYGVENFTVEILKENIKNKCVLSMFEYYYIKKYRTFAHEEGYNIADGGHNGNTWAGKTKEEKEKLGRKISESLKKKYAEEDYISPLIGRKWTEEQRINTMNARYKLYNSEGWESPLKGRTHTEETKRKMREKRKGKTPCIKPVLQYTKEGEFIKRWASIKEAGLTLGVNQEGIGRCCRGKYKTAGGYVWRYEKEGSDSEVDGE